MTAIDQERYESQVATFGPEPIGAAQAGFLLSRAITDASGRNNPVGIARGPRGDPTRTAAGDLGPLQGFLSARTTAQPGAALPKMTALPSTKGSSIQDRLGALGI